MDWWHNVIQKNKCPMIELENAYPRLEAIVVPLGSFQTIFDDETQLKAYGCALLIPSTFILFVVLILFCFPLSNHGQSHSNLSILRPNYLSVSLILVQH